VITEGGDIDLYCFLTTNNVSSIKKQKTNTKQKNKQAKKKVNVKTF